MASNQLATYLNDHLAGSVVAIEMMDHIVQSRGDTDVGARVRAVEQEVQADRRELQALIDRLGAGESAPRKAAAWLSERMARLKLMVDDPHDGAFRLFEALEAIALGVQGKHALWRTLSALSAEVHELQGMDYERLIARAESQHAALEPLRVDAARAALTGRDGNQRSSAQQSVEQRSGAGVS